MLLRAVQCDCGQKVFLLCVTLILLNELSVFVYILG